MLAVYWPVAWFALFLIVPFEAFIGGRYVSFDSKQAIKVSLYANLVSTLLGIPMAWLLMLGVEMAASLLRVLPGGPLHSFAASLVVACQCIVLLHYYPRPGRRTFVLHLGRP